jgi:acetylornithine deacetylase/succinyl-diaminopimelate desuccinylase-like protein
MNGFDRRQLLAGAAAALALPAMSRAAAPTKRPAAGAQAKIRAAIDRQLPENIARIQEWIRHPGIAAENWQMEESCAFTMGLLKDAGFQTVKRMPTKGQPGIFATLDAGAKRTVGIYFMYDVKQVNPAEWSSPPFEARITDKPGWAR